MQKGKRGRVVESSKTPALHRDGETANNVDVLVASHAPASAIDRAARRTLDVVLAAASLVVLSPLFALIALTVLLESPGPVLYRAERVGRDGRPLRLLK